MTKLYYFVFIGIIILAGIGIYFYLSQEPAQILPKEEQEQNLTTATTTTALKTYRNEEWGFEFEYPKGWSFHEKTFYSPFSMFNLVGASPEENNYPDPLTPSLLVNIVTHDFADRAVISKKNLGSAITDFTMDKVQGKKYEYLFEGLPKISIDIPFGEYRMLLNAKKQHEDVFNQILVTFKFLK